MSVQLDKLGWDKAENEVIRRAQKLVLNTSDGRTFVLIGDFHDTSIHNDNSEYGLGDEVSRLMVYEISSDFQTVTKRVDQNLGGWVHPLDRLGADLFSDDDIGVVYQRRDTYEVCFRRINTSTWSVGGQEVVWNAPDTGAYTPCLDVSISDGDVPAVILADIRNSDPKLRTRLFVKSGSWVSQEIQTLLTNGTASSNMVSVTIQWVHGGSSSTRPLLWAIDYASEYYDHGCELYSAVCNESTGNLLNVTLRTRYGAGEMSPKVNRFTRRTSLFPSADGEVTIARSQLLAPRKVLTTRVAFDGNAYNELIPPQTSKVPAVESGGGLAMSYANETVNFYFIQAYTGKTVAINMIAKIADGAITYSGPFKWDNAEAFSNRLWPMAGTGRNSDIATYHAMLYINEFSGKYYLAKAHQNQAALPPTEVKPSGEGVVSGTPVLSLKARLGKAFPQSRHKAIWQLALDAGFTTSLKTYIQPDSKFVRVENTQEPGSYVFIEDVLPEGLALNAGSWNVRAALIDEFNVQGPWSGTSVVDLSHPPAATGLQPSSGVVVGTATVQFIWQFTDPLESDSQTAYRVVAEDNNSGQVVFDTQKQDSSTQSHIEDIDEQWHGQVLRWYVILWDTDDTPGAASPYATFSIAGPPTVTIDAPTPGSVAASGTPLVLFTPTVDGGRRIKAYAVTILKGGEVVKTSGTVAANTASGQQISWRPDDNPLLEDETGYEVFVSVTDETNLTGDAGPVSFTVNYVAPQSASNVVVNSSNFNIENAGYISVTWSNANQDPDFEAWVIERKDDFIDGGLNVVEEGTFQRVGIVEEGVTDFEFKDYRAPSGAKVGYIVRQLVDRDGDKAISANETSHTDYPVSEGYWIIEPFSIDGASSAFRLSSIIADSYSDEYEENEYILIGKGRHVDQGDHVGVKGTLTAKIRDTPSGTARMKKRRLERARGSETALFLRNPFGDVYEVSLSNLSISRVAGVGRAEFVDVEIPYAEVNSD